MPDPELTLRALREEAGLTLEELAKRVDYSPGHLRQIEAGTRCASPRLTKNLTRAFVEQLSLHELKLSDGDCRVLVLRRSVETAPQP